MMAEALKRQRRQWRLQWRHGARQGRLADVVAQRATSGSAATVLQEPVDQPVAGHAVRLGFETEQQAMAQHRAGAGPDVVEGDVEAAGQQGARPCLSAPAPGRPAGWPRTAPGRPPRVRGCGRAGWRSPT